MSSKKTAGSVSSQNLNNKVDVLFIHPVVHRKGQLLHVIMPVGLFSLASTLRKNGYKTKIIHVGVEEILDQNFSLPAALRNHMPDIVCIDLNWYVHTFESLEIARTAKECCGSLTVLGGFTASFFDNDLLAKFPYVDAVIRGDGEMPLLKLVTEHFNGKEYNNIPNATYRKNGQIIRNDISYVNHGSMDTEPPELELLDHWDVYLRINLWGKADIPIYALFDPGVRSSLDLIVFRGCPYKCTYCGGGKEAQSDIFGRHGFAFKDIKKVVEDCIALKKQGVEEIRVEYVPHAQAENYYMKWFETLQKENLRFDCRFSLWKPPSPNFIKELKNTFDKITIVMSPDSGSERIRKKHKYCYYTNRELYELLESVKSNKMESQLYFMTGFPGETREDYMETLELAKDLLRKELTGQATCFALNIEPGSPFHLDPERYGIKVFRKTLEDFYDWGKQVVNNEHLQHYLGYERDESSEKEILDLAKEFNREMSRIKRGLN